MTNSLLRPSPQTRCDWKSLCSRGSRLASKSGRCSSRQGRQTKPTPWTVAHSSALSIETITLSPCKTGDETANPVLDGPPRCLRREFLANRRTALIAGDPANLRSPAMFVATAVESGIPARLQFSWPRPNNSAMAAWESPTIGCANALEKLVVAGFAAGAAWSCTSLGGFWHTGQERLRQCVYEREQPLLAHPQIANFSGHAIQTRGHSQIGRASCRERV